MNIRTVQMVQFDSLRRADTHERLFNFLRSDFAQSTAAMTDSQLSQFCDASIDLCVHLRLYDFQSMAWFASTRLVVHPRFYEHPELNGALTQPDASEQERIINVLSERFALDWHEAACMESAGVLPN